MVAACLPFLFATVARSVWRAVSVCFDAGPGQEVAVKNNGCFGVGEKEVAAVDVALLAEGRGMEDRRVGTVG